MNDDTCAESDEHDDDILQQWIDAGGEIESNHPDASWSLCHLVSEYGDDFLPWDYFIDAYQGEEVVRGELQNT